MQRKTQHDSYIFENVHISRNKVLPEDTSFTFPKRVIELTQRNNTWG